MSSSLQTYTAFLEARIKKNLDEHLAEFMAIAQKTFDYEVIRYQQPTSYEVSVDHQRIVCTPLDLEDPFALRVHVEPTYSRKKNNQSLRIVVYNRCNEQTVMTDVMLITRETSNVVKSLKDAWDKGKVLQYLRTRIEPKAAIELNQSDALLNGKPLILRGGKALSMYQSRAVAYVYANVVNSTYPLVDLDDLPKSVTRHLSDGFIEQLQNISENQRLDKETLQTFLKNYPVVQEFSKYMMSYYF